MYYVLLFLLFLIIFRAKNSKKVNKKVQLWINLLIVLCGVAAIGIVIYAFFSVNH